MFISISPYSDMDKSILMDEYTRFRVTVATFDKNTPYYVYCLTYPDGQPFYIGKGKDLRAFNHLRSFIKNPSQLTKRLFKKFTALGGEPPIMHILHGNLDEDTAFELEKSYIQFYRDQLANVMPGGQKYSNKISSSIGGKIGGITTRSKKLGIFSESYDRGKQTRLNFESGVMDHIDFVSIGKIAGAASVISGKGIHDKNNQHLRIEWAKIGAEALTKSGNRGGIFSKKWREENKELYYQICQKAGKIGGKITGSMPWWTDGIKNIRSYEQPSQKFKRGMTKKKVTK